MARGARRSPRARRATALAPAGAARSTSAAAARARASSARRGARHVRASLHRHVRSTRTSAVKRGKWVLGQLLCTEPPPPPPGVEGLVVEETPTGTLRQRLEKHRASPVCSSCHTVMDPIGFGFENFDGIGRWRTEDQGFPVDASGELPGGQKFSGPVELKAILHEDERFGRCVAQKMLTYALGRGVEAQDRENLAHISEELEARGQTLKSLIKLIVTSEPFRMRRGEAPGGEK